MFPLVSLRQLVFHLFDKSQSNCNKYKSIVICILSLSITKPETTCTSSLESVCSGQLPVFFNYYLPTRLFGLRMYREQWLSKCTAWNCPLPLEEDPSSCRFFFSLCLWFLVFKKEIPLLCCCLSFGGNSKNSDQYGATFLSCFLLFFLGFRSCIKPFFNLILFFVYGMR